MIDDQINDILDDELAKQNLYQFLLRYSGAHPNNEYVSSLGTTNVVEWNFNFISIDQLIATDDFSPIKKNIDSVEIEGHLRREISNLMQLNRRQNLNDIQYLSFVKCPKEMIDEMELNIDSKKMENSSLLSRRFWKKFWKLIFSIIHSANYIRYTSTVQNHQISILFIQKEHLSFTFLLGQDQVNIDGGAFHYSLIYFHGMRLLFITTTINDEQMEDDEMRKQFLIQIFLYNMSILESKESYHDLHDLCFQRINPFELDKSINSQSKTSEKKPLKLADSFDYVICSGYLGFSLTHIDLNQIHNLLDKNSISNLFSHDTLNIGSIDKRLPSVALMEEEVNFIPTFPVYLTKNFDRLYFHNELPSWSDRILFGVKRSSYGSCSPLTYNSVSQPLYYIPTRHLPVRGEFEFLLDSIDSEENARIDKMEKLNEYEINVIFTIIFPSINLCQSICSECQFFNRIFQKYSDERKIFIQLTNYQMNHIHQQLSLEQCQLYGSLNLLPCNDRNDNSSSSSTSLPFDRIKWKHLKMIRNDRRTYQCSLRLPSEVVKENDFYFIRIHQKELDVPICFRKFN
ncbi:hypothetical protein SNEBB_006750 [Seison nebaliae]|nr:hypothetical protein SNEBB_006750 [Seison nebaliae]